jgi:hypothetical protein
MSLVVNVSSILQFGSLLKGASAMGIWPPPTAPYAGMSWRKTKQQLQNLKIISVCDPLFHLHCRPSPTHGILNNLAVDLRHGDSFVEGLSLDFQTKP